MTTTLKIQNLKCGGCANTITSKLSGLDAINDIKVIPENNSVAFSYKNETILNDAKMLLAKLGYPVLGNKNALTTKAKSFVSCAIGRIQ